MTLCPSFSRTIRSPSLSSWSSSTTRMVLPVAMSKCPRWEIAVSSNTLRVATKPRQDKRLRIENPGWGEVGDRAPTGETGMGISIRDPQSSGLLVLRQTQEIDHVIFAPGNGPDAIGRKSDSLHPVPVAREAVHFLAVRQAPEADGRVRPARKGPLAVRGKSGPKDVAGMALHAGDPGAARDFPEPKIGVTATGKSKAPVGGERSVVKNALRTPPAYLLAAAQVVHVELPGITPNNGAEAVGSDGQHGPDGPPILIANPFQLPVGVQVPDMQVPVEVRGDQLAAVGREQQLVAACGAGVQAAQLLAGLGVPQADQLVGAAGREPSAVAGKGNGDDVPRVALEAAHFLVGDDVAETEHMIVSGIDQPAAIRRKSGGMSGIATNFADRNRRVLMNHPEPLQDPVRGQPGHPIHRLPVPEGGPALYLQLHHPLLSLGIVPPGVSHGDLLVCVFRRAQVQARQFLQL